MNNINSEEKQYIIGRGAVTEAIKSGHPIDCVMIAKGSNAAAVTAIALKNNITVKEVNRTKLDGICPGGNHQGVIAAAAAHHYAEVEDILKIAEQKGEPPLL